MAAAADPPTTHASRHRLIFGSLSANQFPANHLALFLPPRKAPALFDFNLRFASEVSITVRQRQPRVATAIGELALGTRQAGA
jgi:hypothetical protein